MVRRLSILTALTALFACNDAASVETKPAAPVAVADAASAQDSVVATWNGGSITDAQLQAKIGGQLTSMEVEYLTNRYQAITQGAEQLIVEQLLEAEAKKVGMNIDQFVQGEVEKRAVEPTAEEVAAFYAQVQGQLRGATLEEVEPMLRMDMMQRKQQEAFMAFVAEIKTQNNVKIVVPMPEIPRINIPIEAHNPSKGPADAPITIIEFADFQCPYCSKVIPSLKEVEAAYPGKIRFVWKDFPLGGHPRAIPAAVAMHCAGDQGKVWEMYDVLFENSRALEDADLKGYATRIGLDVAAWEACTTSGKHEAHIQADFKAGETNGVSSTPSLFVNGILVAGALPFEHFKEIIDRELAK